MNLSEDRERSQLTFIEGRERSHLTFILEVKNVQHSNQQY